jgi:hypothetical protein
VGSLQWCVPDPNDPDRQICEDIPVLIEPPRWWQPDPKTILEPPEEVRTDVAVLVGIDRLAASVQDNQLRARLLDTVDQLAAQVAKKLPSGVALKRAG